MNNIVIADTVNLVPVKQADHRSIQMTINEARLTIRDIKAASMLIPSIMLIV